MQRIYCIPAPACNCRVYENIPTPLADHMGQGSACSVYILHRLVATVWCTGIWPADWCKSICVPILKKGDPREHANYRTLSLIFHASKILLCIIKERIHGMVEFESSPEQAGFRQGRGTHNHVTSLRILTEKARNNHCSSAASLIFSRHLTRCVTQSSGRK